MATTLKPFVINLNDLSYLLAQVGFVPLFDAGTNGNGIVAFDGSVDAYSAKGELLWDADAQALTPSATALGFVTLADLGTGFPHVSSPIGIRDVSGLYNNLFGSQADWGTVDVPFRRDIAANFDNYVTTAGADYGTTLTGTTVDQVSVTDLMPRIISRTITTGGVNLLKDASGHFVVWDSALYGSDATYAALIDGAGVTISQLVEGAKIVAPGGMSIAWDSSIYQASLVYKAALFLQASTLATIGLGDGKLYGSAAGGALVDGQPVFYKINGIYQPAFINDGSGSTSPVIFDAQLFLYKTLVGSTGVNTATLTAGQPILVTTADIAETAAAIATLGVVDPTAVDAMLTQDSGYGLLETIGHIDFQNPNSGEFFIGSENPGVAPVNSWFGIFGQFFDHGLDLIGKGGQGTKITITFAPDDPLNGALGPDGQPASSITVNRATVAGADANGDPNYVNHTSPFIDQSQTYGSVDQITQLLRKWVSTDNGATFHAGMEMFDGQTLVDAWERRWPDGTSTMVHDTLPTLSELRDHVLDTGRAALTWEDVADYRNRDLDSGALTSGNSGHALILDMNTRFDAAHLDSAQEVGNTGDTVGSLVADAVTTLNNSLAGSGMSFGRSVGGSIELVVTNGAGAPVLPDGTYTGATALAPWINFADFSIMSPPPGPVGAAEVMDAVGQILMASVGDHYIAGDGRVNENFGLTSIHHVFHEEHNYQVENLKTWIYAHDTNNPGATDTHEQLHNWQVNNNLVANNTDASGNYLNADGSISWDANKMFNATKLVVEMEYQHAAVDQYARTVTPRIQEFVGYSTGVDPTVSLEYAQVAFRFGHSTIRETIDAVDPDGWMLGHVTRYALEKAFLNPQQYADTGVAAITLGLSRQQMNEVDELVTPALNQGLLGQPLDLPAINIARGRDLGIPTLNDFRAAISLAEYTSWSDFGANMVHPESLVNFIAAYSFSDPSGATPIEVSQEKAQYIVDLANGGAPVVNPFGTTVITANDAWKFLNNQATGIAELDGVRGNFDKIDAWIGGLAEAHVPGGLLGETFDAVFVAQIQSLMDGDRFYYLYRLFGTQLHEEVNNGQFKDIVERNTGLTHLNGSIFAYADKYYDFNRNADGLLPDGSVAPASDNTDQHLYAAKLAANTTLGIYSDGGVDTAQNGGLVTVDATDYVRPLETLDFIQDTRPELDPTQVHPLEGTPTSGADSHEVIVATDRRDFIHARAGDDTVYGEGGDDYLFGDGGIDRLYGGDGNDVIDGGEGPDLMDGGAGKDVLYGRGSGTEVGGFDQIIGGSGNDLVIGGEGIDKLSGGSGDDIIYGDGLTNPEMGNTDAFTHAGDGNDYMDLGASGDLGYGEEGDDYIVGGIDQDLLQGGYGDDIIRPGSPSQAINGGPDEVIGGNGGVDDQGFDLIDFSDYAANAPGIVADMVTQFNPLIAPDGQTPFPAWFQIEGVIGTANDDAFIGTEAINPAEVANLFGGGNWLIGGSGSDSFTGLGGNDVIIGGSIRLDALIGSYADAANASGPGNLALGSSAWLADAMRTGSLGFDALGGPDGYDNDAENAYTGASNQATGALSGGLLAGVGFDLHFTEMLRSRMFKDVVLGDGGADAAATDTALFVGGLSDYTIDALQADGTAATTAAETFAYRVSGNTGTAGEADGTDILVGIDRLQFNGAVAIDLAENGSAPLTVAGLTDLSIAGGADAARFQIGVTGQLEFVTPPNFEAPTDTGANNVYDVQLVGTTAGGLSVVQAVAVTVTNADEPATGGINVDTTNYAVAGNSVTLNGLSTIVDPDVPGGVTMTYALNRTSGNATSAGTTINAGTQISGFSLGGSYTQPAPLASPQTVAAAPETIIVGTSGSNSGGSATTGALNGTAGADLMFGLNGNDLLIGGDGNDVLDGGAGNDSARYAGPQGNYSFAQDATGAVTVSDTVGTAGIDTLRGIETVQFNNSSAAPNTFALTTAAATGGVFNGTGGRNLMVGSAVADTITAQNGDDIVFAGGGDDTIIWNVGNGRDFVDGGDSSSVTDGGVGGSTTTGDTFVINGNTSSETFNIYASDQLPLLATTLATTFRPDTQIVVTRTVGSTTTIVAELKSIEELQLNSSAIPGAPGSTTIGSDTVNVIGNFTGLLNPNTITITSDNGHIVVDVSQMTSDEHVVLNTGGTYEVVNSSGNAVQVVGTTPVVETGGGTGGATGTGSGTSAGTGAGSTSSGAITDNGSTGAVVGTADADIIAVISAKVVSAGAGDDVVSTGNGTIVNAGDGADIVTTGDGNNVVLGGDGNDILTTGAGNDKVFGEAGDDLIDAGAGNDMIWGGDGDDEIHAGDGADRIESGQGSDLMFGDDGDDLFVFRSAADADGDQIADFAAGDRVDLTFMDANAAVDGNNAFHFGTGTTFSVAGELIVAYDAATDHTTIAGNTDANAATAEFQIVLQGDHVQDLKQGGIGL